MISGEDIFFAVASSTMAVCHGKVAAQPEHRRHPPDRGWHHASVRPQEPPNASSTASGGRCRLEVFDGLPVALLTGADLIDRQQSWGRAKVELADIGTMRAAAQESQIAALNSPKHASNPSASINPKPASLLGASARRGSFSCLTHLRPVFRRQRPQAQQLPQCPASPRNPKDSKPKM